MWSLIIAIVSVIIQGCLQWWDAAKDPPRSAKTRKFMGGVVILLTFILMGLKCSDILDMQQLQDRLEMANRTSQDTYFLSKKLDKLLSYSILDHAITEDDEQWFLSFVRHLAPMNLELSASKWSDGSYHFYWYEGTRMVAVCYFDKEDVAWLMPKIHWMDMDEIMQEFSRTSFEIEEGVDIWEPGPYPAGSAAGEVGREVLKFLSHIGIRANAFCIDSQRKVLQFVLGNPSPRLLMHRSIVKSEAGAIVEMHEMDVRSLMGKPYSQMLAEAFSWVQKTFGPEFISEPLSPSIRRWKSNGNIMNIVSAK